MDSPLLTPTRIGRMALKNRIIMPAMGTAFGDARGFVTQRLVDYLVERAKGGVSLIIVGVAYVHINGRYFEHQVGISDDKFIPKLKALTDAVHRHGAKIAVQLHHGGRLAKSDFTGMPPVAPSAVAFKGGMKAGAKGNIAGDVPRPLTVEAILEIEDYFAEAAVRAKKAGFDGIELHGAHGYLIDQFLSRSSNKRIDDYGGSVKKRARFLVEIIEKIKARLGTDFPVWCRINGKEFGMKNPTVPEDASQTALLAQQAGADAINVSATGPESPIFLTSAKFKPAVLGDLAKAIRDVVDIPVIVAGKNTVDAGEELLNQGKADIVAIGRGHLADPNIVNKLAEGRKEDIVPCILCMKCIDKVLDVYADEDAGIVCSVNAALGREKEAAIRPAGKSRKVLVVGGGPGGLEAARVLALRGHRVTLMERGTELGGQLIWAGRAPYKDRIEVFRKYLIRQVKQLGVTIELGNEATAEMVETLSPEVVIIATGGVPVVPNIPGLSKANYFQSMSFLRKEAAPKHRILVIGGGLVGCEIAELLADEGKKVTLIDVLPEIACAIGPSLRCACLDRLESKKVTMLANIKIDRIEGERAALLIESGETITVEFDTILLATGFTPDTRLYDQLKGRIANIHKVGDCVEPRSIRDAVSEGYQAGLRV